MLIAILPLVAISIDAVEARVAPSDDAVVAAIGSDDAATAPASSPATRTAQVQLAELLGAADSVESVTAHGNAFTFVITRGDHRVDLIAATRAGEVTSVLEHDRGQYELAVGSLSWLVATMQDTIAITRLDVDEDGAVTLTTSDGARYMAIPGRGSGGNAAVEARWAGEWDHSEG